MPPNQQIKESSPAFFHIADTFGCSFINLRGSDEPLSFMARADFFVHGGTTTSRPVAANTESAQHFAINNIFPAQPAKIFHKHRAMMVTMCLIALRYSQPLEFRSKKSAIS